MEWRAGRKLNLGGQLITYATHTYPKPECTRVFREIETAVPDERILVLFVPYILLAISYNTKVNLFGLNEVKIEIDSPGAGLCTCLVPNLYFIRYPK